MVLALEHALCASAPCVVAPALLAAWICASCSGEPCWRRRIGLRSVALQPLATRRQPAACQLEPSCQSDEVRLRVPDSRVVLEKAQRLTWLQRRGAAGPPHSKRRHCGLWLSGRLQHWVHTLRV
jgi:hypothetical protein